MKNLWVLLLLAGLWGCKRLDGDTLCEGTVVDKHTNARVAYATVAVSEPGSSGGLGGGYTVKEEHQADASGNFSFQINSESEGMLLQAYTSQGYYTPFQEGIRLRGGKNNKKLVLPAQAPAWLRVHIVDQAPRDTAVIGLFGFAPTSTGTGRITGDTTLIIPTQGNTTTRVQWKINYFNRYAHPLEYGDQTMYCSGLDTTTLQVTY